MPKNPLNEKKNACLLLSSRGDALHALIARMAPPPPATFQRLRSIEESAAAAAASAIGLKVSALKSSQLMESVRWIVSAIAAVSLLTIYANWELVKDRLLIVPSLILHQEPTALTTAACRGKHVYMYDLPPAFNDHILRRACMEWTCSSVKNHGLGLPARTSNESGMLVAEEFPPEAHSLLSSCRLLPKAAWFTTGQFALEILVHERMRSYECRTNDPEIADLFYIPYYAGIDVSQYLFTKQVQLRDKLSQRLLGYLQANPYWSRRGGKDHLLVLGRIVWDFGRNEDNVENWGSSLLSLREVQNVTKVLIERSVWSSSQIAVPYPTGFHPSSDAEMQQWLQLVKESPRDILVSFAGSLRHGNSSTARIRNTLTSQCQESPSHCTVLSCQKFNCEKNPELVSCLALKSVFCLMPPGDSPTRKGLFDSLLSGCIPVVFSEHTAYTQYLWHLPSNVTSYSVFFPQGEVVAGSVDVVQELIRIPPERIRAMQDAIAELLPGIVYARQPNTMSQRDAFDIILENVLRRVQGKP